MTRSVRIRLMLFLLLAVVGLVYVGAAYLGLVDKALGRGVTVSLDLPASGGLYVGSEVDYRGVKIGKVERMHVTPKGVRVTLALEDGARVPRDADVHVASVSAVGEQYVNFVPRRATGPFLADGDAISAGADALPQSTDALLTSLSRFTDSVDQNDLRTVVAELGTMFRDNADNLRTLVDSGSTFIDTASKHQASTIDLLTHSRQVLATQQRHAGDIRAFAAGLAQLTGALRSSDPQLRTVLAHGPGTAQQATALVDGLQPVLPAFLANLVTVNQVVTARLPAVEQTLVTLPVVVKNGLIGTPGDGYGHLNMQLTYTTPVCTQGYKPPKDWLPGTTTGNPPAYPARCTDARAMPSYAGSDPITQRGVAMAPTVDDSAPIYRIDPSAGDLRSVLSDRDWESMFVGTGR